MTMNQICSNLLVVNEQACFFPYSILYYDGWRYIVRLGIELGLK